MNTNKFKFDEIGCWSEIKLDIIKDYASAYSKILSAQQSPKFYHIYIDAFAGAGLHISRDTKDFVLGSPMNALKINPPFCEYYFIDLDKNKIEHLKLLAGKRNDLHYYEGNCNVILQKEVFPKVRYEDYRRALCLLDPYGLHLNWEIIKTAGHMKSIDMFLNFPILDMNRNVLWQDQNAVDQSQIDRMNNFWGDESWRNFAYTEHKTLFWNYKKKN